jgi:hypothetical protein
MDALLNILMAGILGLGVWVLYLFAAIIVEFLTRPFRKLGEKFLKSVYNSSFLLMSIGFVIVGLVLYLIYIGAEYFRLSEPEGTGAFVFIIFSGIMLVMSIFFLIGLHLAKIEEEKTTKTLKQQAIDTTSNAMLKKASKEVKDEVLDWFD